jgi:hypothetical protein
MFKTEQEALEALRNTISELDELTKSWSKESESKDLKKWTVDPKDAAAIGNAFGKAEGEEEAPAEAEASEEASAHAEAPEEATQAEAPAEESQAEGEDGEGDVFEQIVAEAATLADEELDMLLHALMAEKDKRGDNEEGTAEEASEEQSPAEEQAASVEPEETQLAMSMKSELSKMAKSFETRISSLTKSVDSLREENDKLRKQIAKPASKPAPSNSVEVLQKSTPVVQPMSKSEQVNYLLGEMRRGNRTVRSEHVALVNACRTDADLNVAADILRNQGIEFPNKK